MAKFLGFLESDIWIMNLYHDHPLWFFLLFALLFGFIAWIVYIILEGV